ncbi:MAG: hypothetical protein HQK89_09925 [Nitrospirae bacterium]|nr:hypothetical protein [Nitrospirota bacterium]
MMTCKHKTGLLVLRDCGNPVVALCTECNKPVCSRHMKYKDQDKDPMCPDCMAGRLTEEEAENSGLGGEYRRQSVYRNTGYAPYRYGGHSTYSSRDYGVFDYIDTPQDVDTGAVNPNAVDNPNPDDSDISPSDFHDS